MHTHTQANPLPFKARPALCMILGQGRLAQVCNATQRTQHRLQAT